MNKTRKTRGVCATEEGRKKLLKAKAAKGDDKKPWTFEDIATDAKVDTKTVQTFFNGRRVDKESACNIVRALDLLLEEVVDPDGLNPPPQPVEIIGELGSGKTMSHNPGGISQNVSGQVYGGLQAAQGNNNQQIIKAYTAAPTEKRK